MTTSVNTNLSALVALRTLNSVTTDLNSTQKRVSTGYTVADGFDNGAIFAIAQSVRNSIAGVGAVNSELKGSQGLVSVANASLTQVSDLMTQVRDILTRLSDQGVTSDTRNQFATQFVFLMSTINGNLTTAVYQGTNLVASSGSLGVIQDILANQLTFAGQLSTVGTLVSNLSVVAATSVTSAGSFLLNTFLSELNLMATSLNTVGSLNQAVAHQVKVHEGIQ